MDPILISVIAGVCGLVCAGFMTYYVINQPQTYEASAEAGEYMWMYQGDAESAGQSAELSQPESEETAVPVK